MLFTLYTFEEQFGVVLPLLTTVIFATAVFAVYDSKYFKQFSSRRHSSDAEPWRTNLK